MRLRNKVLAAALATAMIVPVGAGNVFAATGTIENTTETTNVKYTVTQGYEWSIHSEIDFGKDKGIKKTSEVNSNNPVKVTKNIIPEGQMLKITVEGSGTAKAFTINNGKTETLGYDVNNGGDDNLTTGGTVLTVNAGTNDASKNMKFTLHTTNKAAEVAGTYNGTVTYTASIVSQN